MIRFWKSRIEQLDSDQTFSVGLIYGPSGCGKSSLVKAGLLPRLCNDVIPVYVEASPDDTEVRLLRRLRKQCPTLDKDLDLKDSLAALRKGIGLPVGKKVVFIIDQFEQWLHANREEGVAQLANAELTRALRQCDGSQVQCILMVRDGFWMAVTRLLHELEVELVQGLNFACVDLFPTRHAEKVLMAFGRAFGALDEESKNLTSAEKEFVKQAVAGLAEDGKVICVRLALFAEMMKGRSWTLQSLKQVGGTDGVGLNFLEETFNSTTNPKYRLHQNAARSVLQSLLPETGTDIKGEMRSHDELLEVSGYAQRPQDFAELMSILDLEVRLVTPTDPEGRGDDSEEESESSTVSGKYYQLTHDYLVHSLRQWLTRKEKESRSGRARLRLQDLSATWSSKPENRYLPTLSEFLRIRFLTSQQEWTGSQSRMMRRAGVVHGWRAACTLVVLLLVGFIGLYVRNRVVSYQAQVKAERLQEQNQTRARNLVDRLATADIEQVRPILVELQDDKIAELARTHLHEAFDNPNSGDSARLNLSLVLAQQDSEFEEFLADQTPNLSSAQYLMAQQVLQRLEFKELDRLLKHANDTELSNAGRFQAIAALSAMDMPDDRWQPLASEAAKHLTARVPPGDVFFWLEQLKPKRELLIPELSSIINDRDARKAKQRETACLVLSNYLADDPRQLINHLVFCEELHEFLPLFESLKPHPGTVADHLLDILDTEMPRCTDEERDRRWKSKAIAAVALIKLGRGQSVWPYLKHSHNPSLRSFIVHFVRAFRVDYDLLLEHTRVEADESIRRALILGAGHFEDANPPSQQSVDYLQSVFQHDTDPGVHGAAEFTLRQWKVDLPTLSKGLERTPPERITELKQLEQSIEEAEKELKLAIESLSSKRDQWETSLVKGQAGEIDSLPKMDLKDGLVLHVPFDETDGGLANNLVDSGSAGEVTGPEKPSWSKGVIGNAINLNGTTHAVVFGDSFNPDLTDSFSIGCWIYFENTSQVASLVSKMDRRPNKYRGFDVWFEAGRVGAHFKHSFPENMVKMLTTKPLTASRWHQVWVVYEGGGVRSKISLIVDGNKVATDVLTSTLTKSFKSEVPLKIGSRQKPDTPEGPNEVFAFEGQMDDVRIYDRVLSEEEIKALYLQGLQSVASVAKTDRTAEQEQILIEAQRTHDAGIRALNKQVIDRKLALAELRWKGRSRWFQNSQGQTMVIVPQPLADGKRPFDYEFAMGATEVTVEEFKRFNPTPGFLPEIVPTEDCPAHQLNWFDAAKYCNWLSDQDGIPKSQWCYLPNDEGKWEPGAKIKSGYEKLLGYRLPTTEEWEYSAKALSRRKYGYGEPVELLSDYGWYAVSSQAQSHPVGSLLPNDFGLFDMHGNVWEWILDKPSDKGGGPIDFGNERRILGGGFNYRHFAQRSENSFYNLPNNRVIHFGFRVVRILPESVK